MSPPIDICERFDMNQRDAYGRVYELQFVNKFYELIISYQCEN